MRVLPRLGWPGVTLDQCMQGRVREQSARQTRKGSCVPLRHPPSNDEKKKNRNGAILRLTSKADNFDPTKDKMASGPAGSFSPIFAQAADELGKDGIAGGNSSATNEMSDAR